jgi:hypothetical protein
LAGRAEKITGKKMSDFAKAWSNPDFIKSIQKNMGVDKFGQLAVLMLRLSNFPLAAAMNGTPDEKVQYAEDLRLLIKEFDDMLTELKVP